ncbi:unnamed protein product [Adineta steineri]|uniref:Uncharacterized protein n=1 Tax=Adineta steineri TaxID=433720 RepID=A0A818Z594_9BILA|nr:unnamed protein product [Adineta steineri]CAF3759250.1 unnamed protein product [Adineta steineri]
MTQDNVAPMLLATIPTGGARAYQLPKGFAGNFKHGWGGKGITLFEISVQTHDANTYYDLSVIDGFNVPMKVYAPDGTRLEALHSSAPDAYLYPTDDTKTHGLRGDGRFVVVFERCELREETPAHPHPKDKKKNIFIADFNNHRIVEWKNNATEGQIIAGGNGQGNRMDQLDHPTDVIFDQQNHSIIIADSLNKRVIQWTNQTQQILIPNINCYGLAMDKQGFLYISDRVKNEVRRWKIGQYNNAGIVVAGGNEKGNQLNQLYGPTFIFVDEYQSIYVSDSGNHRVMKWIKDAKEETVVAGGNGEGRNLSQLPSPYGVIVDNLGKGEVAVSGNGKENQLYGPVEMLSILDNTQPLSKRKQKAKVKFDQQGTLIENIDSIPNSY